MGPTRCGLIVAALLSTSCGLFVDYPDRRDARIVTHDPTLIRHAQFAVAWWNEATGQVTSEVTDNCDMDRTCVYMTWANLDYPTAGQNQNWDNIVTGENGSRIKIDIEIEDDGPDLRHVVAHEIGHSMNIQHSSGDSGDLMRPTGFGPSCIDEATLKNWRLHYGNSRAYKVVCSFELDEAR